MHYRFKQLPTKRLEALPDPDGFTANSGALCDRIAFGVPVYRRGDSIRFIYALLPNFAFKSLRLVIPSLYLAGSVGYVRTLLAHVELRSAIFLQTLLLQTSALTRWGPQ
jgi:hypothetical protein